MTNDLISDMLTRIRNAKNQKHRYVDVVRSKMIVAILDLFKKHRFIRHFILHDQKPIVRIYLRYAENQISVINDLKRESKPGKRVYVKADQVPIVRKGLGFSVISTSRGVVDSYLARRERLGGELICSIF